MCCHKNDFSSFKFIATLKLLKFIDVNKIDALTTAQYLENMGELDSTSTATKVAVAVREALNNRTSEVKEFVKNKLICTINRLANFEYSNDESDLHLYDEINYTYALELLKKGLSNTDPTRNRDQYGNDINLVSLNMLLQTLHDNNEDATMTDPQIKTTDDAMLFLRTLITSIKNSYSVTSVISDLQLRTAVMLFTILSNFYKFDYYKIKELNNTKYSANLILGYKEHPLKLDTTAIDFGIRDVSSIEAEAVRAYIADEYRTVANLNQLFNHFYSEMIK